jgi:hypothetical protein
MISGIKSMFDDSKSVKYSIERFAANKYLFVSHWIASAYPSSKVSSIVLNYSTPWPRRSYKGTSINGVSIVAILTLFEVIMGLPSSLQNEICKFILVAFLANVATSELLQKKYQTWVKIAVMLFVLVVLYSIGRLLGYVFSRVSGKHRWSRPLASADESHRPEAAVPVSTSLADRRASMHMTRRASVIQAMEALQQVTDAVLLSEAKNAVDDEITDDDSDADDYFKNADNELFADIVFRDEKLSKLEESDNGSSAHIISAYSAQSVKSGTRMASLEGEYVGEEASASSSDSFSSSSSSSSSSSMSEHAMDLSSDSSH